MTVTSRSRHKLLHISSRDKATGTNSNFTVNLSRFFYLSAVKSVVLKQLTVENVFYNINASNNIFTYNIASSPSSVNLPSGQYTIAEFMSALQALLITDGIVGCAITQNSVTKKIEINSTTAFEMLFDTNIMANVLGIESDAGSDTTTNFPTGLPALEGVRNIAIGSNVIGENNFNSTDTAIQDIFAIIPVTESFGEIIQYVSQHSEIDDVDSSSRHLGKNITHIDIKLTNKDNNLELDLQNHNVDILLKVYY